MVDIITYRIRIGSHHLKSVVTGNKNRGKFTYKRSKNANYNILFILLLLLGCAVTLTAANYSDLLCNDCGTKEKSQPRSIYTNWNKYMRSTNGNTNTLTVAHLNAGSSYLGRSNKGKDKLNQIKYLLENHKIDVLGISEANIESSLNNYEFDIKGYKCFKSNGAIARVACYVKSDLKVKLIGDTNSNLARIWLEIGSGINKWYICNYYREFRLLGVSGSESLQEQKSRFDQFLKDIDDMENKRNAIILGDFNIDLTDNDSTFLQLQQEFKDNLLNYLPLAGYTQIIKNPTRHCNGKKSTLIDHIWLNNLSKMEQVCNISTDSDHDLIMTKVRIKGKVKTNEKTISRDFKLFDQNNFNFELSKLPWDEVYNITDPTLIANKIMEFFTSVLNKHAPLKSKNKNCSKGTLKLSKGCLNKIKERDKIKAKAIKSGNNDDWRLWRIEKNKINNLIRNEKKKQENKEFSKVETGKSCSELWNYVKRNAGWIKSLSPKVIKIDEKYFSNSKDIANLLNKYFISKVTDIVDELKVINSDPTRVLRKLWDKWKYKNSVQMFEFQSVNEERVKELFKQLKNTHSECMDGISNKIIKGSSNILIKPMTHLINSCFSKRKYPSKWKIFKMISLFKNKGDPEILNNYRPIALLNPFSKILEKELFFQMNDHMITNDLWNKNGYAYKKNHSTSHALMDLVEIWCSNIDGNAQNMNMMLDLSCAFDLVSHDTLLSKMKIYKFGNDAIQIMESYLNYRSQYVEVNGKRSNFLWNKHGVPQGSIMGPLLFSIYSNELSSILNIDCQHNDYNENNDELFGNDCSKCGLMITFADDSTVILETMKHDYEEVSRKLDNILDLIENFLKENNLKLNKDKTNLIRTTTRQQLAKNGSEKVKLTTLDSKGKPIVPKNNVKLLGLNISSNLTWTHHLETGKEAVFSKCKKRLGALKFVGKNASVKTKKLLANACIMSKLLYGITIWGTLGRKNITKKAQIVQNLVCCWITGKPKWTNTNILLKSVDWLSIYQLATYHTLLTIWKIFKFKTPSRNLDALIRGSEKQGRIELTDRLWSIKTQAIFWSLDISLRMETKVSKFKSGLKKWVKTNIPIEEPQ